MIRSFYNGLLDRSGEGSKRYKLFIRAGVSTAILAGLLWWLPTDVLLGAIATVPWQIWGLIVAGFLLGHLFCRLNGDCC